MDRPAGQNHKLRSSIFALILFALIASAAYYFFVAASNREIDSLAVLPFENLTGHPDLAYLSDGLSESLIDRLSELPQLKVISRNSSFKFRGPNIDVRDVASQLHVRAILTGSVTQVGDDLVIRFDIVDAPDDRQISGGQYRRKVGDILRVQNEIAQTASEQLRLKLTDSQSRRLAEKGTEDSEAYRYYLSGLVELNGPQFVQSRALEYFERAVTLDPAFAAAHAEIAWVYWSQANGSGDPREIMPKAKLATERALAIDPNLAKAHVVMAMVKEYEFDWAGAEREYVRAIELSPNLDFARNNYAFFLSVMGRQDDALAELEQQRIRDPTNQRMILLQKGIILSQARRFDDALLSYEEAHAVEPGKDVPNFSLGYAYAGKGSFSEAAGYYKKSVDLLGGEGKYSQPLVYLAATYAKLPDKRGEARAILTRIEAMGGYISPALLAAAYSALDDNDKAMELLERAYVNRDLLLRFIKTGYEYDGLRADPRFVDLTKRIGLSQ
ncbi:MAG: serine/threonine protein kinase with repeat [Acidobacteria bacterium]|nr:serine/threonine protein kinase with repeat [Acidobacteriota bacterium]